VKKKGASNAEVEANRNRSREMAGAAEVKGFFREGRRTIESVHGGAIMK